MLWGLEGPVINHGPVTMRLVYPGNGVEVGQKEKFWIGWEIILEQGWHTYWKHPGDVGLSPSIKWKHSNEYRAGELIFPPPVRVSMSGISSHGYYGETLFLIPVSIGEPLESMDEIELHGQFSWMACSRTCMPASRELSISIPVVEKFIANDELSEKFQQFWKKQPKELPESWDFQAHSLGKFITLKFPRELSMPDKRIDFFAEDRTVLSDQEPQVRRSGEHMEWLLEKSPWKKSGSNELAGLLAVGEGKDLAYYRFKTPLYQAE